MGKAYSTGICRAWRQYFSRKRCGAFDKCLYDFKE